MGHLAQLAGSACQHLCRQCLLRRQRQKSYRGNFKKLVSNFLSITVLFNASRKVWKQDCALCVGSRLRVLFFCVSVYGFNHFTTLWFRLCRYVHVAFAQALQLDCNLRCTALRCAAPRCAARRCSALRSAALRAAPRRGPLRFAMLHFAAPCSAAPRCAALRCAPLRSAAPRSALLRSAARCSQRGAAPPL